MRNNQPCDNSNIINTIIDKSCDLGIKFDQDGDRIYLFDKQGKEISSDIVLLILAKSIITSLSSNIDKKIVIDIKISNRIAKYLEKLGYQVIVCRSGHVFIKEKILLENALLAGELSGHIYFKYDVNLCYDDPIFAAIQLISAFANNANIINDITSSDISFANVVNREFKIPIANNYILLKEIKKIIAQEQKIDLITIDGIKYHDINNGWWLIRSSNTEPIIMIIIEGYDEKKYHLLLEEVVSILKKTNSDDSKKIIFHLM